jgi:hypothetical protein
MRRDFFTYVQRLYGSALVCSSGRNHCCSWVPVTTEIFFFAWSKATLWQKRKKILEAHRTILRQISNIGSRKSRNLPGFFVRGCSMMPLDLMNDRRTTCTNQPTQSKDNKKTQNEKNDSYFWLVFKTKKFIVLCWTEKCGNSYNSRRCTSNALTIKQST